MDHKPDKRHDEDEIVILLRKIRGQLDDITDEISDLIEDEETDGGQ